MTTVPIPNSNMFFLHRRIEFRLVLGKAQVFFVGTAAGRVRTRWWRGWRALRVREEKG
jgi:hypothetical protein